MVDEERRKMMDEIRKQVLAEEEAKRKAEDKKPPKASKEEIETEEPRMGQEQKGGRALNFGGGGILPTAVISLLVTLAVIMGMGIFGGGSFVTKSDFTKNIGAMSTTIAQSTKDIQSLKDSVNTAVSNIPSAVSARVTEQMASITSKISNVEGSVNNMVAKVDANTSKMATLEATVNALNKSLSETNTKLTDYETRIKKLETNTTTTTTTNTPSNNTGVASDTLNGVTVSITSYTWLPPIGMGNTGSGAMLLTAGDNGTGSTSFQLIVHNTTGKTIQNLTMTLGFSIMDYTSSGVIPNITVTPILTSQGGLPQWIYQSSGSGYVMFYNGAFAGFFGFNPPAGDTTIYCTLNIPGSAGATGLVSGHQYYLFPMIKIASFN